MKKILLLFCMAFAIFSAYADNYFTMGVNDSFRIRPSDIMGTKDVPVYGHFDGRLDIWSLIMTYPDGLDFHSIIPGPGMNIPFVNYYGHDSIHTPSIATYNLGSILSTNTTEYGYYDYNNDNILESYGKVKWEAGDYLMFYIRFSVGANVATVDTLTIDGTLSATHDWRGGTIPNGVTFYKEIEVRVGYMKGDVNGDEVLTIADLNILIDYVLNGGNFDEYQLYAADLNDDGQINTTDVAMLNNILLFG